MQASALAGEAQLVGIGATAHAFGTSTTCTGCISACCDLPALGAGSWDPRC